MGSDGVENRLSGVAGCAIRATASLKVHSSEIEDTTISDMQSDPAIGALGADCVAVELASVE